MMVNYYKSYAHTKLRPRTSQITVWEALFQKVFFICQVEQTKPNYILKPIELKTLKTVVRYVKILCRRIF